MLFPFLETDAELLEFEAFRCERRDVLVTPTLFDRRASALRVADVLLAQYVPASPGWPLLLLCCWPERNTAIMSAPSDDFARGAHMMDAFLSERDVEFAEPAMIASLGSEEVLHIGAMPPTVGRA